MKGTPITDESFEYIVQHFAMDERALLKKMKKNAVGIPEIMISEEQAKFLGVFLRATKAKRVLDIGTLFGYSAAIMSQAVGEDGEVVTLEFEAKHADAAQKNFDELGMNNITLLRGAALEHMQQMPSDSFDLIHIDADKANYSNYLRESLRLVKNGGVIAGDNALAWGKITTDIAESDSDYNSVRAMQNYNKAISELPNADSIIVPVGDGLLISVVRK